MPFCPPRASQRRSATVAALAKKSGDARFAYDSYRRFITMYSDVVLGIDAHHFEELLDEPHPAASEFRLDRYAKGDVLDERGAGPQPNLH